MNELLDPTTLIATGAIVIFLTQQAKRWVRIDFLPLTALGFGIAIQVVNDLALNPEPFTAAAAWTSVLVGAGTGMVAAGAYDLAGRAAPNVTDAADTVRELLTAGYDDDRADVVEFAVGDTVYAGPANTMVDPGTEIRPADILGITPVGGDDVSPQEPADLVY